MAEVAIDIISFALSYILLNDSDLNNMMFHFIHVDYDIVDNLLPKQID